MTTTFLDSALRISAIRIGNQMDQAGLPAGFIGDCVHAALASISVGHNKKCCYRTDLSAMPG